MVQSRSLSVIDLFCGTGGFTLGAYRAGFDVSLGCDIDKISLAMHLLNFPKCKASALDLGSNEFRNLIDILKNECASGVIGGPPCQGFSNIGKRDLEDPRNSLFKRYFEIVKHLSPSFFIAENVPGLLNERNSALVENALSLVSDYNIAGPVILNASDFGCPTSRRRVFIIGIAKNRNISAEQILTAINEQKISTKTSVGDALYGLGKRMSGVDAIGNSWGTIGDPQGSAFFKSRITASIPKNVGQIEALSKFNSESLSNGFQTTQHSDEVVRRFTKLKPGELDKVSRAIRLDPQGLCPVLRAGTGRERGSHTALRPIHPQHPRMITSREAARLQGFPDWFLLHPTTWHSLRHIGNSVPPILAEKVLTAIRKFL